MSPLSGLILCLWLLLPGPAQALDVTGNHHALSGDFEYLEDPGGALTLEQLLAEPDRYPFNNAREGRPQSVFVPTWFRLQLTFSESTQQKLYYLFGRVENLYDIRLYRPDPAGGFSEIITGNYHPVSSRELAVPRYGFTIEPAAETMTLYLRIIGGPGTSNFPWDLVEQTTYHTNADLFYAIDVAALSAIAALLLFNLIIALTLRAAEYLYYCAYVFSVLMAFVTLDGIGFYYLWPDNPELNTRALHSLNLFSASMRLLTIMSFLGLAAFAPRLHRLALGIVALLAVTFLSVNLLGIDQLPPYAATLPWIIGILYGFVICGHAIRRKIPLAIPLFITLLIPSVAAIAQAAITVSGDYFGMLALQLARVGFVLHVLLFSLCLAAHIRLETQSRKYAMHDSLTGLPGTRLLQERFDLAASLSRREGTQMAVLFIDLDGFKAVNDSLGHAAGDQLLTEVGGRMQRQLRSTDTVARIGGDEFAVLLTQLKERAALQKVVSQLLETIAEPFLIDGREARVSGSIGVAMHPTDGEDLETLLKASDEAMYAAKREGKNRFRFRPPVAVAEPEPLLNPGTEGVAAS